MNLYQMPYFNAVNLRQRIVLNCVRHVRRTLPGKGTITISKNEEVKPETILGKYTLRPGFSAIKIASKLKVDSKDGAKYIQRQTGATIFKGELLAQKIGLFGKINILAPTDGVLDEYNLQTGELRLKFLARETPLASGVYGIVEEVDTVRGEVLIKTMVTEIFGILGSGKERSGILNILSQPGSLVEASQITTAMNKHIVVAGSVISGEVLRKAAGFGVLGIIAGGIQAVDYTALTGTVNLDKRIGNDVGISVLATEGFGLIPIGDDIYKLLYSYDGKFIFINGNAGTIYLPSLDSGSILALRKIALPVTRTPEVSPEINLAEITVGRKVRVIWPPFMGAQGIIRGVDKTGTLLESGISTILVIVETPFKKIKVPFTNLEIIS